ncbi:MAG: hypothetical protein LBV57_07045 [Candidatus Symbiothrix sp.]|jgi:hypothetical protein|nr:hypothetical protein [Candidatus Symbiothrix sp.]
MKKMFLLAFVSLFIMTAITSCEKDEDNTIPSGAFNGKIQATVSTNGVEVDTVKAFVWYDEEDEDDAEWEVARGVYKNGDFTLNLPEIVPAKYLETLFADAPDGIKVSNAKVKCANFEDVSAYYEEEEVGEFYYGYENEKDDYEIAALFIYVDRDVNITGSYTEYEDGETYTETDNVSLKKGWNTVYRKYSKSGNEWKGEITTTAPKGLKWYFDDDNYNDDNYIYSNQTRVAKVVKKYKAFSVFKK